VIYPTKTVDWSEVRDWCWKLAENVRNSGWKPDVVVAVGRGGMVVSRILSDLLRVDKIVTLFVKWYELDKKPGETYLAELIRAYARAHRNGTSPDEEIYRYVRDKLRVRIDFEQDFDMTGQKVLLTEEISATGMHIKLAKEVVEKRWNAEEARASALIWKAPSVMGPEAVHVDYYVVKPAKFVWFQFPWSRLADYIQFLKVMTEFESPKNGNNWSEQELIETFRKWYGDKIDTQYFREALKMLKTITVATR